MENQRAKALLEKYNQGLCSAEEKALVESWFVSLSGEEKKLRDTDYDLIKNKIWLNIQQQNKPVRHLWPRIGIAASILLILSAGGYFLLHKQPAQETAGMVKEIKPGSNGAVLTLANGQKVVLGNAKIGMIASQNGAKLNKAGDSLLVYNSTSADASIVNYNTLETPRGKQYSVVLADGSKVWLNAGSSLKYPTSFSGKERLVELQGEGLFEVAHNAKQPFKVKTSSQTVEDMGTIFNINSYPDEPSVKTTLVAGSVKINGQTILKPGEQAILNNAGKLSVHETDVDEAIAWKNGKFIFEQENIPSVMRKLARWYDVEVIYNGSVSEKTFTSSISRFDNIQKILDKITFISGVHFKTEGRRIIVDKD